MFQKIPTGTSAMKFSVKFPPSIKTSWRCHNNVSLYIPATLQVRLKWNIQQCLDGTSQRRCLPSWRSLYVNLLKTCPSSQVFFKEFYHRWRTALLKNSSWWLFVWKNWFWKHSCMAASQRQLQTYIHVRILHFLLRHHVKEEQIFIFFLREGFDEKCKHTELSSNFVQKQYFS